MNLLASTLISALLPFAVIAIEKASETTCPLGWYEQAGECYFFHYNKELTWEESQYTCQMMGGYLVEPKTEFQQSFLTGLAFIEQTQLGAKSWWIGLSDQGHEDRWIWHHSITDVTDSNWASGTPEEDFHADCALMNANEQYQWTAESCDELLASPICQLNEIGSHMYYAELKGGTSPMEGNIFAINDEGYLGAICDTKWDDVDAHIACSQLGFPLGGTATFRSNFGDVPSLYAMNNVDCSGVEENIQDCPYDKTQDCTAKDGAGVICTNYQIYHVELRDGSVESEGNVYVTNLEGFLGHVCDPQWDDTDASVVCKQLGFTLGGTATTNSQFGSTPLKYAMNSVGCNGQEQHLQDCSYLYNAGEICNSSGSRGAGVICNKG